MPNIRMALTATTACAAFSGAALAEPAALIPQEGWTTDLSFYLFAPISTTGTSTVAGASADLDLDLQEALEVLDFALSGRAEIWNGDFAIILDGNFLGISEEQTVILPGPASAGVEVEVDVSQSWFGILGAYRVASGVNASGRPYSFDLQAGARHNRLKQEITARGPGPGVDLGGTETWWEPVIGARGLWQINDRWTAGALIDAGGFGAGGNDLAWSATVAFDYSLNDSASLKLGWRYYDIDFSTDRDDGTFAYDISQTGPIIGATFSF